MKIREYLNKIDIRKNFLYNNDKWLAVIDEGLRCWPDIGYYGNGKYYIYFYILKPHKFLFIKSYTKKFINKVPLSDYEDYTPEKLNQKIDEAFEHIVKEHYRDIESISQLKKMLGN